MLVSFEKEGRVILCLFKVIYTSAAINLFSHDVTKAFVNIIVSKG